MPLHLSPSRRVHPVVAPSEVDRAAANHEGCADNGGIKGASGLEAGAIDHEAEVPERRRVDRLALHRWHAAGGAVMSTISERTGSKGSRRMRRHSHNNRQLPCLLEYQTTGACV